MHIPSAIYLLQSQHARFHALQAVPVDTTGDTMLNAVGVDTTGDGELDRFGVPVDTTGDGLVGRTHAYAHQYHIDTCISAA